MVSYGQEKKKLVFLGSKTSFSLVWAPATSFMGSLQTGPSKTNWVGLESRPFDYFFSYKKINEKIDAMDFDFDPVTRYLDVNYH